MLNGRYQAPLNMKRVQTADDPKYVNNSSFSRGPPRGRGRGAPGRGQFRGGEYLAEIYPMLYLFRQRNRNQFMYGSYLGYQPGGGGYYNNGDDYTYNGRGGRSGGRGRGYYGGGRGYYNGQNNGYDNGYSNANNGRYDDGGYSGNGTSQRGRGDMEDFVCS